MKSTKFNLPLVVALAAALSATPALAQGKGNGNGNRDRGPRVEERDDRWDDRDDRDDRQPRFERRDGRRVPPGWCIGRGNPHRTAANCRFNTRRGAWERYDSRTGRWETRDRYESRRGSYDSYGGNYEQAHREFHYTHDRRCRERAAQRPLDLRWQLQVRQECRAIHEDFHRRWGTVHR